MPASWEIMEARKNRLLLAILMPPDLGITMKFARNLHTLQLPPGSDFMEVIGLPYGAARNSAAKQALDRGYNLAFLDADMRVSPDAYMKLLETNLPYVSGLYYQRLPDYLPCMFNEGRDASGNIVSIPIGGWKPGDIVPADFVPAGLLLIRHPLLVKIFERFPLPFYWGLDVAPVPDVGGGNAYPFSEDFSASYRVKNVLGIQPYVHTGVVGLHESRGVIGPKWMVRQPNPDPLLGVMGVM